MKFQPLFLSLFVIGVACLVPSTEIQAGIMPFAGGTLSTGATTGAWKYSESPAGQSPGLSTTYSPTQLSDFSSATFQYYAKPDPDYSATTGGDTWLGNGAASFQVFSTFMQSQIDQSLTLVLNGDDGHSLFVDDIFVGGGGFGVSVVKNLSLSANVPVKLTIAGYNGPANWVFALGTPVSLPLPPDNPQFVHGPSTIPFVKIDAEGRFGTTGAVPEPASIWCFAISSIAVTCRRRRKK